MTFRIQTPTPNDIKDRLSVFLVQNLDWYLMDWTQTTNTMIIHKAVTENEDQTTVSLDERRTAA
jgi:hypothetical protein